MWKSSKRWELPTIFIYDFIVVDILNRMGPLRMLYSVSLANISRLKILNVNISETVSASAKKMREMTFIDC